MESPLKTATAKKIIKEVRRWINQNSTIEVDYSRWYVGVTNNPTVRRSGHKQFNLSTPNYWKDWNARSSGIALALETYYHKKGMLETDVKGGVKPESKYLYIYKKHLTILD